MNPSYSAGLPHSFQGGASPNAPFSTLPVFRGTDEANTRGDIFLAGERSGGDSGACCLGRGVLLDPLFSPQDGRSDEACHKPKSTQFLGSPPAFQDGGYPHATGDSSKGQVACQVGLEGRLLHSPSPSGTLEVPPPCGRPSSVPIYASLLCSLGFYQGSKASRCLPEKFRSLPYHLYRRYPNNREIPRRSSESHGGLDRSIRGSKVYCQYGEVRVDSVPADQVPGAAVGGFHYVPEPPRSQDQDDSGRSCSASLTGQHERTHIGKLNTASQAVFPAPLFIATCRGKPCPEAIRATTQFSSCLKHLGRSFSGGRST